MTQAELDTLWQEALKAAFETFSRDYLGATQVNPPACFGTGDGLPYCVVCSYKSRC